MPGPYHLYDADGNTIAGDKALGDQMRQKADEVGGYIKDEETGEVIYPEETH